MEKRTFLKAVEKYQKHLVRNLIMTKVNKDLAHDVVQSMVAHALESKFYNRVSHDTLDGRMKGYLMQATRWELGNHLRKNLLQDTREARISEYEYEDGDVQTEISLKEVLTPEDILECPFCHVGVLNEYKACALCHTILGQQHGPAEEITTEQMLESECPDLGMFADVNLAFSRLDDIEQKVVHHIVQGNETLEDLVELTRIPRTQLWRIWTRAKAKLQQSLFEYSHTNV